MTTSLLEVLITAKNSLKLHGYLLTTPPSSHNYQFSKIVTWHWMRKICQQDEDENNAQQHLHYSLEDCLVGKIHKNIGLEIKRNMLGLSCANLSPRYLKISLVVKQLKENFQKQFLGHKNFKLNIFLF